MKVNSSESEYKTIYISSTIYKRKQSKTVLNKYINDFDVREKQEIAFFTGESNIMDYGLVLKIVNALLMDFLFTSMQFFTLIDGLELLGSLVDYCDVFISCSNSHSDGTHSLQRIHW